MVIRLFWQNRPMEHFYGSGDTTIIAILPDGASRQFPAVGRDNQNDLCSIAAAEQDSTAPHPGNGGGRTK